MTAPDFTLTTKCAHWGWDDHRFFGYSVFDELTGTESMTGIAALAVLGRRLPNECCGVLDDIVCTSTLADPRIWPLKMTRLVAAFGAIMPALAAGLLAQEGARIGPWTLGASAQVLSELCSRIAGDEQEPDRILQVVEDYLRGRGMMSGFGTPYRQADERLKAFRERIQRRGRDKLPHWRAMELVTPAVRQLRHVEPNISIGVAAALLDMGIAISEIAPLAMFLGHHMFFANACEGAKQSPELLRHIPDECVRYVGAAPRVSPRASQRASMVSYRRARTG